MSVVDLRKIGSIDVLDLDIISRAYGRDFLPYPFVFTQPSRFSSHDDYVEYARSMPDRFTNGDLRWFHECAVSYANADIRVECHVQYIPADTPSLRVVAFRLDQAGFLAKQRPDGVIDVYELSPYLLGQAIAESVGLEKGGRRSRIVIPEYVRTPKNNVGTSDEFTIQHTIEDTPNAAEVPSAQVTAYSTVQTHWRPTRNWGVDEGKNFAVWVRIKNDGDYLYNRDFSEATPVAELALAARIDELISEDVKAIRQFRNG